MEKIEAGEDAARQEKTFFIAECMEFIRYGEYTENVREAEDAVAYYKNIPSERLNAGKGIGIHVEEDGFPLEFHLVSGRQLDMDLIASIYDLEKYPQILKAAKELIPFLTDIEVIDTKNLLSSMEKKIAAEELAAKIIALEKMIEPDFYTSIYEDEEKHKETIVWQLLSTDGTEQYLKWLQRGEVCRGPEVETQIQQIKMLLENTEIEPPQDLRAFVYIPFSENKTLYGIGGLPLAEGVALIGELDNKMVEAKKKGEEIGYDKTDFEITYLDGGELMHYAGRQDLGDGEGDLFDYIRKNAEFYLYTEDGQKLLGFGDADKAQQERQELKMILEEMLPTLKYHCNLENIEREILEERKQPVSVVTERDQVRQIYQRDVLQYVRESRIALNMGKVLPRKPDIREYEKGVQPESCNAQIMEEIKKEAESYGITIEAYAEQGYKPQNRKR